MSMMKSKRKFNLIKDLKQKKITIKRIKTTSNTKTKCKVNKLKK